MTLRELYESIGAHIATHPADGDLAAYYEGCDCVLPAAGTFRVYRYPPDDRLVAEDHVLLESSDN